MNINNYMNRFNTLFNHILSEAGLAAGGDPGATIGKGFTELTQGIQNTAQAQIEVLTKQSDQLKKQLEAILAQIAQLQKTATTQSTTNTQSTTTPTSTPTSVTTGVTPAIQ